MEWFSSGYCFRVGCLVGFVLFARRWPRVDIDEFGAYKNEKKKNKNVKKNNKKKLKSDIVKNRKN